MKEEPGKLFIQVKNSHSDDQRKISNALKLNRPKKHGHGIGLKNVQYVVGVYNGHMEIEYKEEFFLVKLVIFAQ